VVRKLFFKKKKKKKKADWNISSGLGGLFVFRPKQKCYLRTAIQITSLFRNPQRHVFSGIYFERW